MKILVDMNLSPAWVAALAKGGYEVVHWSNVGMPAASDREILGWARSHGHIVFTHDLDFGAILAATGANAPSVVQLRTQGITRHARKPCPLGRGESHPLRGSIEGAGSPLYPILGA